jgi:hypothetical protein
MPASALVGEDEEVFEVQPGTPEEGRVVVKEESEPDDALVSLAVRGDEGLAEAPFTEEVRAERVFRADVLLLELLVAGKLADEGVERRYVRRLAGADHEGVERVHELSAEPARSLRPFQMAKGSAPSTR